MNPIVNYSPNGHIVCSIPDECTYDNANCNNTQCSITNISGSCSMPGLGGFCCPDGLNRLNGLGGLSGFDGLCEQPPNPCCNVRQSIIPPYCACQSTIEDGQPIKYPTTPLDTRTTYSCSYIPHRMPVCSPLTQLMAKISSSQQQQLSYGNLPAAMPASKCTTYGMSYGRAAASCCPPMMAPCNWCYHTCRTCACCPWSMGGCL